MGRFAPAMNFVQECPAGEAATGIHGRSGGAVDALGLICGPQPDPNAGHTLGKRYKTDPNASHTLGKRYKNTPATGEAPPEATVVVLLDVEVFDQPGGSGQKIGELKAGSTGVYLVAPCRADHWCQVKGNVPTGTGWVWSGPGYQSLKA